MVMRLVINDVVGELTTLAGCSQVCISHSVFLPKAQRGKGKGFAAHGSRLNYIRELGYDLVICTVDMSNHVQVKILELYGWTKASEFMSSKTDHMVGLYVRPLNPVINGGAK